MLLTFMNSPASIFLAALSCACLGAQEPKLIHGSETVTLQGQAPDPRTLQKIFSNLGPATNAYFTQGWWNIIGPNSGSGFSQFTAMPFTPQASSHVWQLRAAIKNSGVGANQVNLSLYSDAGGVPATLLAGPVTVTNLSNSPACCQLAVANFGAGVAVIAGTQYWVVADTPSSGTGSDFRGLWAFVPPSKKLVGQNLGQSWYTIPAAIQDPAGAVYGTIP